MNMISKVKLFTISCLVFVCLLRGGAVQASEVIAPSFQPIRSEVSAIIEQEMERTGTVGLSIGVIDDQKLVWAEGFGWADKNKKIPATPETVYQLASVTKIFTVFAAMKLAEQDRLNIDKPLQDYLPSFSIKTRYPNEGPITVRNIMTHHSGIPSDYFSIDLAKPFSQVTNALKDQYACFPPNLVFSYSNPGMIVLGDAVSTVAGKPYDQYVRESLLDPLGMDHSFFETEKEKTAPFSKSYDRGKEQSVLPTIGVLPAAGLYSNVPDLAKFVEMIFADGNIGERQLFRKETIDETLRVQNERVPLDGSLRVGLGWMLGDSAIKYAGRVAGHEGHFNGYATNLILLPDYKLGVIVLANSPEADKLVDKIATDILKRTLALKKGLNPPPEKPKIVQKASISKQTLEDLSGYYGTYLGAINVTPGNNKLLARTADFQVELLPREDNLFSMHYSVLGLFRTQLNAGTYFSFQNVDGRDVVEIINDRGVFIVGEKAPKPYLPDEWGEMPGTYELTGSISDFSILPKRIVCKVENQRVIIEMRNHLKEFPDIKTWGFLIQPLSSTEGTIVGLGRWKGDTIRREVINGVQHIFFAGLVFKKSAELE